MKRSIHWILIITLLVSLFPVPTFATEEPPAEPEESVSTQPAEDDTSQSAEDQSPTSSPSPVSDEPNTHRLSVPDTPVARTASSIAILSPPSPPGVVITQIQTRGISNASEELIELYNNSDQLVDVTDWCLRRASAIGSLYTKLACFTTNSEAKEERVVLPARSFVLAVSSTSSYAGFDLQFSAGMSDAGGRVGLYNRGGVRQDLVGWGSSTIEFETTSASALTTPGTLLQRKSLTTNNYQDTDNNVADFEIGLPRAAYSYGALSDETDFCLNIDGFQAAVPNGWSRNSTTGECLNVPVNKCKGLAISEIGANMTGQFIELHNTSGNALQIGGCKLQTNRSKTTFSLPNHEIAPRGFLAIDTSATNLTLSKTTSGTVYLLWSDETTEIQSVNYEDLAETTSWAWFGGNDWRQTYVVTPGKANSYQQYANCETGYVRNRATGRCNKVGLASVLVPCREDQYRSEETNRCRSIALTAASVLKPCNDDQFRNPATNRCKKIASADDLADCGEGRERNPTTNRCRNAVQSDVPAAAFAVEPIKESASAFVGWWALGGVATLGLGYAGWEWRREVTSALQKALAFFRTKA